MDDNAKLVETLLERAAEYVKSSYELVKLKVTDKTSDVASTFITHSIIFVLVMSFLLFFNLGLAFWLGEILGEIYFGFFVVAAFYGIIAIFLHFFMFKRIKKLICNYIIKNLLK
ncbi:MAG: phage holin family protein [Bacteroidales bacterium]|jgi:hypothetical protein